jgi:hypothetical protein
VVSDPFHFEAVPDPDPDPTPRFRHVGIQVMIYIHSSACLHILFHLVSQLYRCDNIQYFEQYGTVPALAFVNKRSLKTSLITIVISCRHHSSSSTNLTTLSTPE